LAKLIPARMFNFRVYLLDYDGTLAATRPAGIACLTRTLGERGTSVPEELMNAAIGSGMPLERVFATLVPALTTAEIAACVARYRALYPLFDRDMTSLYDGAYETVAALHRGGREIVVLSNKGRAALETALARFDLLDMTSAVLAADPGVPLKPDPQTFHERVQPLFDGLARSDFVMVGDTAADIAFAQAVGIASCWVRYGYGDAAACLAMKPDCVVDALPELLGTGTKPEQDSLSAAQPGPPGRPGGTG